MFVLCVKDNRNNSSSTNSLVKMYHNFPSVINLLFLSQFGCNLSEEL